MWIRSRRSLSTILCVSTSIHTVHTNWLICFIMWLFLRFTVDLYIFFCFSSFALILTFSIVFRCVLSFGWFSMPSFSFFYNRFDGMFYFIFFPLPFVLFPIFVLAIWRGLCVHACFCCCFHRNRLPLLLRLFEYVFASVTYIEFSCQSIVCRSEIAFDTMDSETSVAKEIRVWIDFFCCRCCSCFFFAYFLYFEHFLDRRIKCL